MEQLTDLEEVGRDHVAGQDTALRYVEISLPERKNGFVYFEQFGRITTKRAT